jgi:hypothetical protein
MPNRSTIRWYWQVSACSDRGVRPSARGENTYPVGRQCDADGGGALLSFLVIVGQDGDGDWVEGDVTALVQLGVGLPHLPVGLRDPRLDHQHDRLAPCRSRPHSETLTPVPAQLRIQILELLRSNRPQRLITDERTQMLGSINVCDRRDRSPNATWPDADSEDRSSWQDCADVDPTHLTQQTTTRLLRYSRPKSPSSSINRARATSSFST